MQTDNRKKITEKMNTPISGTKRLKTVWTNELGKNVFTVKATTSNLIALSKFLAVLKSQYKPLSTSRIFISQETKVYFAYLNFADSEITETLHEVSAFPQEH
jgi:hypothetical protein